MMALPMPVASSTQPSSTKMGTDTSTRLLMPSSMRPTITPMGMLVVKARKHSVPMPKQKAMGTAHTRPTSTKPIRKMAMLRLPRAASCGRASQQAPATAASSTAVASRSRLRQVRQAWPSTTPSMASTPKAMAATRQLLGISSAGVVTNDSLCTYSMAGRTSTARKVATTPRPKACTGGCQRCGSCCTKTVSRRCSLRWMAIAEPSMASHRKAMDTASSTQVSGAENT